MVDLLIKQSDRAANKALCHWCWDGDGTSPIHPPIEQWSIHCIATKHSVGLIFCLYWFPNDKVDFCYVFGIYLAANWFISEYNRGSEANRENTKWGSHKRHRDTFSRVYFDPSAAIPSHTPDMHLRQLIVVTKVVDLVGCWRSFQKKIGQLALNWEVEKISKVLGMYWIYMIARQIDWRKD